ncbi:putative 2-oxoisovalerate dehydrogenase alpha subunit mitochondrial precursor [Serendipita vermifera]|nr:putative 2-oxoisovalerate dehydrogenase alpha subunit mitochondrial precursor [Serendipita vermifera]
MRAAPFKYTHSSLRSVASICRVVKVQHRGLKASSVALGTVPQQPTIDHGYLPNSTSPITTNLDFFDAVTDKVIPAYRVLDGNGQVDENFARKIYETMSLLPTLDNVLYNVQRQGKISFYMTSHGEEAAIIGSAAGLENTDEVMGQYREMGVLLWRGFSLPSVMGQCLGNEEDTGTKGRQMPVHFGSPEHHFHTISSPLATQIPQAAGIGYALKRDPERQGKNCSVVYFGEGAASEGDFHAGMLLASVLNCPTIFFCRNNGFAISTPAAEQYAGDGIASRGPGYGVKTIRVDGNDALAVLAVMREARKYAIQESKPVLVEATTYRVGHHSTSDDSFAYRPRSEVENWKKTDNPLWRMRRFLESRNWWDDGAEEEMKERTKKQVLAEFRRAENLKRHRLGELFTDVYGGEMPWNIKEQREELSRLLKKYGNAWEPWKKELEKFKDNGKDLL